MADVRYINIDFPFRDSEKGFYFKLNKTDKEAIKADLLHLLLTNKGERLYMPDFGSDLKIFNPNGFYTPGEPEVVIEDMFGTNPTTYTNPINNNVDKGDNKYFNVVFNNTGTYEYTLEWNCFQGSSFSNVKITTN